MNEGRVVLTYKLGWIMLWNFPSFSFLEIANIKLLFEIGLWAELNSVKTTNFHNVLSSQKTLSVWRYRVSTTYFCGKFFITFWCWLSQNLTWRRYRASTPYSAQSLSGTWFTTLFFRNLIHHIIFQLLNSPNHIIFQVPNSPQHIIFQVPDSPYIFSGT